MTAQRGMMSEHSTSLDGWITAQMYRIKSHLSDWLSGVERYCKKDSTSTLSAYIKQLMVMAMLLYKYQQRHRQIHVTLYVSWNLLNSFKAMRQKWLADTNRLRVIFSNSDISCLIWLPVHFGDVLCYKQSGCSKPWVQGEYSIEGRAMVCQSSQVWTTKLHHTSSACCWRSTHCGKIFRVLNKVLEGSALILADTQISL